jgi:hypothetical protein
VYRLLYFAKVSWDALLVRVRFLQTYYFRNENLWNDGFLFDFLQKKTLDLWIRQYVIHTGFLFSERFVFDNIIRIYIDNIILPSHRLSIFESGNAGGMISAVIFMFFGLLSTLAIILSLFVF